LSGGEQARVALIHLILSGANLLVLDEPTNHLDVYARAALEESLLDFPETILFVSHDRYFIDRLATRVLGVVGEDLREFMGGYAEYRDVLRRREMPPENRGSRARKETSGSRRSPEGEGKKYAREEARLVLEISRTEEDIRRKQEECSSETHCRNPDLMRRLKREICELEAQLQLLYRKWGPPHTAP
jgi:ATP-binding cassette subfamily F protein 3